MTAGETIPPDWTHLYVGDGLSRPDLVGRPCRLMATWKGRTIRNVLVEFLGDGERVTCPVRCLRRKPT